MTEGRVVASDAARVGGHRRAARRARAFGRGARRPHLSVGDPAELVRQLVASLFLVVLAFVQDPRLVAADTKLDLNVDPWGFLGRALHLWDPVGAGGQLQNQAYGYLFPMGPFYGLGHLLRLEPWVVQRLWWCLVLLTAYHGTRLLAARMGIGTPGLRTLGALAYALAPRITGGLGAISIELWPMAVAPWVLLPLVGVAARSSARRAAARSALAVMCVGGVNAVATGAVLVLPAIFLTLRLRDALHRRLAAWWLLFVSLACVWWLVPLLLLGRYSPPFLNWIESAAVTTTLSSLPEALRGTTHWIAGIVGSQGAQWPAAHEVLTSRATVVAGLELALLGCWGLMRPDLRHGRFLRVGLVCGLMLLTLGHVGALAPPWAEDLRRLLDGPLAPARNLHKFDLVVRLPLVLGLVHVLAVVRPMVQGAAWTRRMLPAIAALAVVAVAAPAVFLGAGQGRSFEEVPRWWRDAAAYLASEPHERTLLLPGSNFFVGVWGAPRDEPIQPVAKAPWMVRDAVPLGSAGATRDLTAVEQMVSSGQGGEPLAALLSSLGVKRLLVRADLDWRATGAPPPLVVRQTLLGTSGIQPGRTFGPLIGGSPRADVAVDDGMDQAVPALQVFEVGGGSGTLPQVVDAADVGVLVGGPEGVAALTDPAPAWVLANDEESVASLRAAGGGRHVVVTDSQQRREAAFASVRDAYGPALSAEEDYRAPRGAHDWLTPGVALPADQTTAVLEGAAQVQASSSVARPLLGQQLQLARGPVAAFDGDGRTRWVSARPALDSWVRVSWTTARSLPSTVPVQLDASLGADVAAVEVRTAAGTARTPVDAPSGLERVQAFSAHVPAGPTSSLELRVVSVRGDRGKPVAVTDIGYGVLPEVTQFLRTPVPDERPASVHLAVRNDRMSPCVLDGGGIARCQPSRMRDGEEDLAIRRVTTPPAGSVAISGTVVARPGPALDAMLDSWKTVAVSSNSRWLDDPLVRPGNVADGDPRTYWAARPGDAEPALELRLPKARPITSLLIDTDSSIAGARPQEVRVTLGGKTYARPVDIDGTVSFPVTVAASVNLTITKATVSTSVRTGGTQGAMPVVVGEVRVNGEAWPLAAETATTGRPCGFGPELRLAGRVVPTAVEGRISDIAAGRPVTFRACDEVELGAGRLRAELKSSGEFAPYTLSLSSTSAAGSSAPTPTALAWSTTSDTRRSVAVAAAPVAQVLTVPENQNDGWEATLGGRKLVPLTVDGWRQGWVVPAGEGGTVRLAFTPQQPYVTGLLVGLLAALVVVTAAVARPARHAFPASERRPVVRPDWVPAGLAAVGIVVIGGVWGAVAVVAAWGLRRLFGVGEVALLALGVLLVAVAAWAPWPLADATNHGAVAQGLALGVLALTVMPGRRPPRPQERAPGRAPDA